MIIRLLLRHLLPLCCTAVLISAVWLVITLPVVGVFILDNAFVFSDYVKFVFYVVGAGIGISTLIMFPLSVLHEWTAKRFRLRTAAVPVFLLLASASCLLSRYWVTGNIIDALCDWPGLLLAFSLVFGFYQVVLWLWKALGSGARLLGRKIAAQ